METKSYFDTNKGYRATEGLAQEVGAAIAGVVIVVLMAASTWFTHALFTEVMGLEVTPMVFIVSAVFGICTVVLTGLASMKMAGIKY